MSWETNLKNQIEKRELKVSPDAWNRLEKMLDEEENPIVKKGKKIRISLFIAASIALILGFFLFPLQKQKVENTQLIETIATTNQEIQTVAPKEILIEEKIVPEEKPVLEKLISTNQKSPELVQKNNDLALLESEDSTFIQTEKEEKSEVLSFSETEIVLQEEIPEKNTQETKFVDPEMLLYSIEHNQSVQQSRSKEGLVYIDLNEK
ncbi:MAG: hypothetical protein PHC38_00440 [Weeksellaceae bacterium]|nr:hypothetical protein [Weeksellaceae bacterium]